MPLILWISPPERRSRRYGYHIDSINMVVVVVLVVVLLDADVLEHTVNVVWYVL